MRRALPGNVWQNMARPVKSAKNARAPRNVMIRAMVTKELAEKLEALAQKEQRSLSALIAILLQRAMDKEFTSLR